MSNYVIEEYSIRQIGAATTLQAVKDYFQTTPQKQKVILKDLRSKWMESLTDGMSIIVATQLENNPKEVYKHLLESGEIRSKTDETTDGTGQHCPKVQTNPKP